MPDTIPLTDAYESARARGTREGREVRITVEAKELRDADEEARLRSRRGVRSLFAEDGAAGSRTGDSGPAARMWRRWRKYENSVMCVYCSMSMRALRGYMR